jgi:Raf kinase inhibitor-like YbhB/YbcL family protein
MNTATTTKMLVISSPAFKANDFIPEKYSSDKGTGINPPIVIKNIPADTKSLALIVDDPDAPAGTFVHWVMWNIYPAEMINENSAPGIQGKNGKGENKYTGPKPPSGTHHYHFKVYALSTRLALKETAGKDELEEAIKNHIISKGELVGLYKKS